MPLSMSLPPSLKEAQSSSVYVFFPILQVQLSSSLLRVTEFLNDYLGSHSFGLRGGGQCLGV